MFFTGVKLKAQERIHDCLRSRVELLEMISNLAQDESSLAISFVNGASYSKFLSFFDQWDIDVLGSDGFLLTFFHRLFYVDSSFSRCSFDLTSLSHDLFLSVNKGEVVGLIGATTEELNVATANLSTLYPNCCFVAIANGFNPPLSSSSFIEKVRDCKVVVVSQGFPLQEETVCSLKDLFPKGKVFITSGAFLSQTSVRAQYYPDCIDKYNLRWLYRAYHHKHVRRRILVDYPKMVALLLCLGGVIAGKKILGHFLKRI